MSRKFVGKKMLVFAQSGVGGAERMSVTITKSLDRDKIKVKYYLVGDFEDERAPLKQFIPDDLSVHCIGSCSSILLILKFFFILAKEKPDVVFSSVLNINNNTKTYNIFVSCNLNESKTNEVLDAILLVGENNNKTFDEKFDGLLILAIFALVVLLFDWGVYIYEQH